MSERAHDAVSESPAGTTRRGIPLLSALAATITVTAIGCAVASIWLMGALFPLAIVITISYPALLTVPLGMLAAAASTYWGAGKRWPNVAAGAVVALAGLGELLFAPPDKVFPGLILACGIAMVLLQNRLVAYFTTRPRQTMVFIIVGLVILGFSANRIFLITHILPLCLRGC